MITNTWGPLQIKQTCCNGPQSVSSHIDDLYVTTLDVGEEDALLLVVHSEADHVLDAVGVLQGLYRQVLVRRVVQVDALDHIPFGVEDVRIVLCVWMGRCNLEYKLKLQYTVYDVIFTGLIFIFLLLLNKFYL